MAVLLCGALITGCTTTRSNTIAPTVTPCSDRSIEIVVGQDATLSSARQQAVLGVLSEQIGTLVHPDAPAVTLVDIPVTDGAESDHTVRVGVDCIPPAPPKPDTSTANPAENLKQTQEYNRTVNLLNGKLHAAHKAVTTFQATLKPAAPSSEKLDLASFLMLTSRELQRTNASQRYVVVVTKELDAPEHFCDGCVDLHGARVIVLGFDGKDGASPTTWTHQADALNLQLRLAGAADVQIFRSDETPTQLFTAQAH